MRTGPVLCHTKTQGKKQVWLGSGPSCKCSVPLQGLAALKSREKPPDGHVIKKIVLAFSALNSIYGLRVTLRMHTVH